jgi:vitamin B12 transporter
MQPKILAHPWIYIILLICSNLGFSAIGQKAWSIQPEKPRIITSSRLEEPINKVTSTISVITEEDIKRLQARTVVELLRNIPGLIVQAQGTLGEETNIRIRGVGFNQVLVLIDGVKVNSPLTGEFDFGDLPIDNVERIEVVRGAHSAFYGSEAIGGVVNIITKSAQKEELGLSFRVEGGNQDTLRAKIGTGSRRDTLGYLASFSHSETKGQFRRDAFKANNFLAQISTNLTKDSILRIVSRYIDSIKELAISPALIYSPFFNAPALALIRDPNRSLERKSFFHNLFYRQRLSPWWNFELSLGWVGQFLGEDNPSNPPSATSRQLYTLIEFVNLKSQRLSFATQHHFYLLPDNLISVGLDYERERVKFHDWGNLESLGMRAPNLSRFTDTRDIWAFYVQDHFSWQERLFLNAGFRLDYNRYFGTSFNPKVSISFWIKPQVTKLKASFGTGFRAPSFVELFTPTFGNRDLDPEKSQSFELGIEQKIWGDRLALEFTYFNNRFTDLITFDTTRLRFGNRNRASIQGIEIGFNFYLKQGTFFRFNYTWTDTEDKTTGKDLPLRPNHSWNFLVAYEWYRIFTTNLEISIVSSQQQAFPYLIGLNGTPLGQRGSGYSRWTIITTCKIPYRNPWLKNLRLFSKINNLLDERDIRENGSFPNPGINFLLGLETEF